MGDRRQESLILIDLADTLMTVNDRPAAEALYRQSLRIAEAAKLVYEHARALAGIADCVVDGDPGQARRCWEQALVIYRRMGVPERDDVERRLAELGGSGEPAC
jgi:hypothetical protein